MRFHVKLRIIYTIAYNQEDYDIEDSVFGEFPI